MPALVASWSASSTDRIAASSCAPCSGRARRRPSYLPWSSKNDSKNTSSGSRRDTFGCTALYSATSFASCGPVAASAVSNSTASLAGVATFTNVAAATPSEIAPDANAADSAGRSPNRRARVICRRASPVVSPAVHANHAEDDIVSVTPSASMVDTSCTDRACSCAIWDCTSRSSRARRASSTSSGGAGITFTTSPPHQCAGCSFQRGTHVRY
ncbi:MAG: hypothetical protein R2726_11775 [Acidimicrobiales bacterium]